jgi:hypothetical protein
MFADIKNLSYVITETSKSCDCCFIATILHLFTEARHQPTKELASAKDVEQDDGRG